MNNNHFTNGTTTKPASNYTQVDDVYLKIQVKSGRTLRHDVWPILTRFDARFFNEFFSESFKPANFSLVKGLQAKDQLKEAMSFEA